MPYKCRGMRNIFFFSGLLLSLRLVAQVHFQRIDFFPDTMHPSSFMFNGIVDINDDLLDDVLAVDRGKHFIPFYQSSKYVPPRTGQEIAIGKEKHWCLAVADLDADGRRDIVIPGYTEPISVLYREGSGYRQEKVKYDIYPQASSLLDVNGDGFLDIFVANDDARNVVFLSDGQGHWVARPDYLGESSDVKITAGNYGSTWTDFDMDGDLDLYISKCFGNQSNPKDPRRVNRLFEQVRPGVYVLDTANHYGLAFGAQSWTSSFGDLDNDGDLDMLVTHHDSLAYLLRNDGGTYVRVEQEASVEISGFPLQSLFRDFDNNGYLDILVAGNPAYLYFNMGDWHFVKQNEPFGVYPPKSIAVGDLNDDGFLDIFTSYSDFIDVSYPDQIYQNNATENHYISFKLIGQPPNTDAIGAKVLLYKKMKGKSAVMIREVMAGESYGIMNSLKLHFGLGADVQIDSVVILWPDGQRSFYPGATLTPDEIQVVEQGACMTSRRAILEKDFADICTGEHLELHLDESYFTKDVRWMDGDTVSVKNVTDAGVYSVRGRGADGCLYYSRLLTVFKNRRPEPGISFVEGDTFNCTGSRTILVAKGTDRVKWWGISPADTLNISSDTSIWVTDSLRCGAASSDTLNIHFNGQENAPETEDVTVKRGEDVVLLAKDTNTLWYAGATADTAIARGKRLKLDAVQRDTAFWLATVDTMAFDTVFCGLSLFRLHKRGYHVDRKNVKIYFRVDKDIRLHSVNTRTDKGGERIIEIYNPKGDLIFQRSVVLDSGTTRISLGVDLPKEDGLYAITTNTETNLRVLGTVSPRLIRNIMPFGYPYRCSPYLEIVKPSFSSKAYYYFYDWEVSGRSLICQSPRAKLSVLVDTVSRVRQPGDKYDILISPNPVLANRVKLVFPDNFPSGEFKLSIRTLMGYEMVKKMRFTSTRQLECSLTDVPPGIFLLSVCHTSGACWNFKLVKLRAN